MAPTDHDFWVAHPDIVTHAIKLLAAAWVVTFSVIGSALVGVILYVWNQHKTASDRNFLLFREELKDLSSSLRDEISKVASNLEGITKLIFDRQNELATKVTEIDTRCYERHEANHKHHRRSSDTLDEDY